MENKWISVEMENGIKYKYKRHGYGVNDVEIKLVSKVGKTHYYSFLNDCGSHFDECIYPTLEPEKIKEAARKRRESYDDLNTRHS
jgi:hypothetical protein